VLFRSLDDGGSFGGSTSEHAGASRGTHTTRKSAKSCQRYRSCSHAPTDSQAGRRRFDPGRPLSRVRAVSAPDTKEPRADGGSLVALDRVVGALARPYD